MKILSIESENDALVRYRNEYSALCCSGEALQTLTTNNNITKGIRKSFERSQSDTDRQIGLLYFEGPRRKVTLNLGIMHPSIYIRC